MADAIAPTAATPKRYQVSLASLLVLVACVGALLWAARTIFEQSRPMVEHATSLTHGDREVRRQAAGSLAEAEGDYTLMAVSALLQAVDDPEPSVRASAATSLGVQGSRALVASPTSPPKWFSEVARALVKALDDPSAEVRSSAALSLQTIYARPIALVATDRPAKAVLPEIDRAAKALAGALNDAEERVRLASISALGTIALQSRSTPPPMLIQSLETGSLPVRSMAAHALGSYWSDVDEAARALLKIIRAEPNDSPLRTQCATSLHKLRPSAALVPDLVDALRSDDVHARYTAVDQLAHYGPEGKAAVPALVEALNDPITLSPDGHDYADVSCLAATALGSIGPGSGDEDRVVEALRQALHSTHVRRRNSAAEALGNFNPPRAAVLADLIAMLDEEPPQSELAWGAAVALGKIAPGTPRAGEAVAALTRSLDRGGSYSRARVAEALFHFGRAASPALPKLRRLARNDSDPQVRFAAQAAVDMIDGGGR